MTITGALWLAAAVAGLASGAAFHVLTVRATRRFDATFEQRGPTGFSTITWQQAIEYRRRAELLGTGAAVGYGAAILALPIGAALTATGVARSRRARIIPGVSRRGAGIAVRLEF